MKTKTLSSLPAEVADSTIVQESKSESHEKGVKSPRYIRTEAQIIRSGKLARFILICFILAILLLSVVDAMIFVVVVATTAVVFYLFSWRDINYANDWEYQKEKEQHSRQQS